MTWDSRSINRALAHDRELAAALRDCAPAMAEAVQVLVDQVEENFATESAAGVPWAPLARSTLEDRARQGLAPGPILQRTGALRRAATSVREHGADHAAVGAPDDHYAQSHAGSADLEHIPRRDFLAVSERTLARIDEALIRHLEKGG